VKNGAYHQTGYSSACGSVPFLYLSTASIMMAFFSSEPQK
jgi:hypothetical protein